MPAFGGWTWTEKKPSSRLRLFDGSGMNADSNGRFGGGTLGAGASRTAIFFGVIGGVVLLDYATKILVQQLLDPYQQVEIIGQYVRLTYIYNPGAAFGIQVGAHSREIFLVLSLVALIALVWLFWNTPERERGRLAALALICGGAVGNLIDRVRSEQGVVDFLDVGVGPTRWPVFNVADIAVTAGAVFLFLSLWKEESGGDRRRG